MRLDLDVAYIQQVPLVCFSLEVAVQVLFQTPKPVKHCVSYIAGSLRGNIQVIMKRLAVPAQVFAGDLVPRYPSSISVIFDCDLQDSCSICTTFAVVDREER